MGYSQKCSLNGLEAGNALNSTSLRLKDQSSVDWPPEAIPAVADLGGFGGFNRTPLWDAPSTNDRLTGTPHLSGYRTKKAACCCGSP